MKHYHHDSYILWNHHGIECMKHEEYHHALRSFQTSLRQLQRMLATLEDGDDKKKRDGSTTTCTRTKSSEASSSPSSQGDDVRQNLFANNSDEAYEDFLSWDTPTIINASATTISDDATLRPIRIQYPDTVIHDRDESFLLDNTTDIEYERSTSIILYNIGLCHIRVMMNAQSCSNNNNNNNNNDAGVVAKSSLWNATKMLRLSLELIQHTLSQFDTVVKEDTVQTWYGLHQIEIKILSAMIYLYQNKNNKNNNNTTNGNIVGDCCITDIDCVTIMDRMCHIQKVLTSHCDLVHFLYSLSKTNAAPCA